MPGAVIVVVYALAVARITRLVTLDKLTLGPRKAVVIAAYRRKFPDLLKHQQVPIESVMAQHADDPPMIAYLVNCPWCMSFWVAAVVAPLAWFAGHSPWLLVPALVLAASYVTGFLISKEG